ncbi:hypothetical protein HPP92_013800 [Vanilla planifolia]|uniref:Uncharacterized protein n=1 Tax=Vanilla planifolia TaxID=51239 RepID=A0A835V0Y9_VANPL|nr:hypothetical protein HPP92_013800 [Vanilla planifolia]
MDTQGYVERAVFQYIMILGRQEYRKKESVTPYIVVLKNQVLVASILRELTDGHDSISSTAVMYPSSPWLSSSLPMHHPTYSPSSRGMHGACPATLNSVPFLNLCFPPLQPPDSFVITVSELLKSGRESEGDEELQAENYL